MRRRSTLGLLFLLVVGFCPAAQSHQRPVEAALQETIDTYLAERREAETISGVALLVDHGRGQPIEVFTGTNGRDGTPIGEETLFQIGSNTKHFTAALILKLEAAGLLNIDQTVGDWLPQYPAWAKVTIRSLLHMTADIPNYSETVEIGGIMASDPQNRLTYEELIAAVYDKDLPRSSGWFYSNTDTVLAALIIEAASGMSYREALRKLLLHPLRLNNTFYSDGRYPNRVLARLPVGIYNNPACLLYQPTPCTETTLAPLLGQDVSTDSLSWAGPAGGIISNPRDLAKWIRALFSLRVFPQKQLDEMTQLVSQRTGLPIKDTSAADPLGFGFDLGRAYREEMGGSFWFYQGTTLGFRAVFAYWPQYDLVITAATNSQPPEDEDQFLPRVVGEAFKLLQQAGVTSR
jgi:D-alanyl-D-alanine carboxypeptidase